MPRLPWYLYASAAASGLPVLAALAARRRLTPARRWIAVWCAAITFWNLVSLALVLRRENNHWLTYAAVPVEGACFFWAMSLWQTTPVARLTVRLVIPLFTAAFILLSLTLEDPRQFSAVAEPMYCLIGLGVCIYTLLTRSAEATDPLPALDWFWIAAGAAVVFGVTALVTPLGHVLIPAHPDLFKQAFFLRSLIRIGAFLAVTKGMLCPLPRTLSGASSSPAPAPSPSS